MYCMHKKYIICSILNCLYKAQLRLGCTHFEHKLTELVFKFYHTLFNDLNTRINSKFGVNIFICNSSKKFVDLLFTMLHNYGYNT